MPKIKAGGIVAIDTHNPENAQALLVVAALYRGTQFGDQLAELVNELHGPHRDRPVFAFAYGILSQAAHRNASMGNAMLPVYRVLAALSGCEVEGHLPDTTPDRSSNA